MLTPAKSAEVHPAVALRCGGARATVFHLEFQLFVVAVEHFGFDGLQQAGMVVRAQVTGVHGAGSAMGCRRPAARARQDHDTWGVPAPARRAKVASVGPPQAAKKGLP